MDVDLDNDGILNCDESFGNALIDYTDINSPILNFQDGSSDISFISTNLIQTGNSNISGDELSNFTSNIDASANSELKYIHDLIKPSNIEFKQNTTTNHTIVNGETFIIIIGPNTKNITLIDPDNILLVDTDFDDIFEEGVTNYSSAEIRFKYNPNPNGTSPYKFLANNINQVTFIHQLNNTIDESTFEGNLILTCFGIDSDDDGMVDAFDADSDNDGISDIIEAQGMPITLSGADSDLDGLDDVFTTPINPVDSDLDLVPDYLDLDSDNDGVYDLWEAGHSLLDVTITDGKIDNAIATIGNNGLVDELESSPDSFILNYSVSDLDSDSFLNYLDLDSDGDFCPDVIEAGFTDPDLDDKIGTSPVTVDEKGRVIGTIDGFTAPNSNYSTSAPILLNSPFEDVALCEQSTSTITIDSTADTFQWEISTDGGTSWNIINEIAPYSGVTTSTLQITDLQLSFDNNLYRVFLQRAGNSCDDISNAITLTVDPQPVIVTLPSDINRCDEDRAGFLDFDLITDQTPQILSGLDPSLDTTVFEVLYFDNLSDAELNTTSAIIANPYRVNTSSNPTIYARVHNVNNTTCYSTVDFKLKVTDTPTPTQPTVYRICDDTASGSDTDEISSFLLNTKDAEILATVTNPGEYTISYHTDPLDAQTSSTANAIDKDTDYQVTTSQRVYVRIENNNDPSQCYIVSDEDSSSSFTAFELIVDPLPVVNTGVEIDYCIVTGDPNPTVDLTQSENQISPTTGASFEYFKDSTGTDLIIDPISYPPVGNILQSVYVKVISDQECARDLVELVLNIGETPNNSFDDLVATECDDLLDPDGNDTPGMNNDTDNITNFSIDQTAIITAINPPINTDVFFYESTSDRNSNSNNIQDLTNYRNNPTNIDITVVPNGIRFPIYYKILSTINNDCEGIGQFYLQIDQVPTVNPLNDLILCDDGDDGDSVNGIVQTFDLESQTNAILGTQDPLDFTVTYHNSPADALSGADPILNTSLYENNTPNLETIYVRVTNNTSGCFTAQTSFDLIVNPLPIANFVNDLEVCDDNTDGSAQNGFSQTFDLELQTAGILGTQDPTQFSVTYHASLANAQAGALPLGSPFSNSVPFSQIIYARVYNAATGCVNDISNFNAIVNPEPTTENSSNLSYCDDDSDGDDTNGFVQNIDLDSQITDILGTLQDPDDFNVTFHETQTDASDGTDALSSPYTNTLADQQTIYVRVENKDTGCVNDDFTFEVIVNPLPKFKVTSPQIVCLSGPPLTLFIENPVAVYDYVWTAPNGDESFGEEITIESGGVYTVTATTTNGTDCTRTREILVNESIIATITDQDVTIVDDSDNNSITIDPTNLGIGDYQYALIDENDLQTTFQDIPVFENLTGGFYTIVVQDKNGCRPDATLVVSVIEYPKFFTPNNDGINDTWAIKGANSTFYPSAQINIFNRFGKVVAQIDVDNPGWDGTYGGKILSSDDYWFSIILVDRNGNARERKGNFSLLRR